MMLMLSPMVPHICHALWAQLGRDTALIDERWPVVDESALEADQVEIVVQLIDANTDEHLWAESWTRSTGDLLAALNEISVLVATRIRTELHGPDKPAPAPPKLRPDLLRLFLLGVQLNGRRSRDLVRQAVDCFERVLAEEPRHAPSVSAMAISLRPKSARPRSAIT